MANETDASSNGKAGTARAVAARARIKFDGIDLAILEQLQKDSKITNATLAQRVGISPPSTLERVKKLEAGGVIKGYRALLDHKAVNKTIQAFVHVTLRVHGAEHIRAFDDAVASFDEIQGAWHTTGEEDFILRVLVTDMDQYERFVVHRLSAIPNIGRVRTSFILSPVKDETVVPLDAIGGGSVDIS